MRIRKVVLAEHQNFTITQRDLEILLALNRYRYLTTSQIHRLLFSENSTQQSARRRLRLFVKHKYIDRVSTFERLGEGKPEYAFYLTNKGGRYLQSETLEVSVWKKARQVKQMFLEHALDISEFRISLEKSLASQERFQLEEFTPDFQMKKTVARNVSKHRYVLYREVHHPTIQNRSYVVHPDALIELSASSNFEKERKLFFLEIDRGTESHEVIRDKLMGYHLFQEQNIQRNFGNFADFRVLFQAHSKRRETNIRNMLSDHVAKKMLWTTSKDRINEDTVLFEPVWINSEGEEKKIIVAGT